VFKETQKNIAGKGDLYRVEDVVLFSGVLMTKSGAVLIPLVAPSHPDSSQSGAKRNPNDDTVTLRLFDTESQLRPSVVRRGRDDKFLESGIISERIKHGIKPK
jgi:hypothetical protein